MKNNFSRPTANTPTGSSYLKRAAFFGLGLLLLYFAVQIMPTTSTPPVEVATDDAGAVAQKLARSPSPVSAGPIVAALILIGGIVLAVFLRKKTSASSPTGHLQTIAEMTITQDQRIRLVRVGEEVLLLGITSGQISLLKSYPADTFNDQDQPPSDSVVSPAFAEMLRQAGERYRNPSRN